MTDPAPPAPPWSPARAAEMAAAAVMLSEMTPGNGWHAAARAFDESYLARDAAGCRSALAELRRLHAEAMTPPPRPERK